MAKKKAGRAPSKVNGTAKTSRRAKHNSASAAPRAPRKPKAEQNVLPGMEQVRHVALDRLCMSIGDALEKATLARQDEEAGRQAALDYMKEHGVVIYKQHGVELILVVGHDKLRVRPVKGEGAAQVNTTASDDESGDAAQE